MKSKKWLVVILAIALVATLVTAVACDNHTHEYTKYESNATQHWKVCPEDGAEEAGSRVNHSYTLENNTKCVCGAVKPADPDPDCSCNDCKDDCACTNCDGTDCKCHQTAPTNVYTGTLDGTETTITLNNDGSATVSPNWGGTHTYELNGNILTLIYESGAREYLELNSTDYTFVQLDAMYKVTYTAANDAILSFDGKGGALLDGNVGTYEILIDEDWNVAYGIKLVFNGTDYEVDFADGVGSDISVTITINATEYVFGASASEGCDNPDCECPSCPGSDCNCGESQPSGIVVADVVGVWTSGNKTVVISTNVFDSYYAASVVIDGKMYIELRKSSDGTKLEGFESYTYTFEDIEISYDSSTSKLTVKYSGWTGDAVDFETKASIGTSPDFTGVWTDSGWKTPMTFKITEDEVVYDGDDFTDISFITVGNYIIIRADNGFDVNDMFVLTLSGSKLSGYWYEEDYAGVDPVNFSYKGPVPGPSINVDSIVGVWTSGNKKVIISKAGTFGSYVASIVLDGKDFVLLRLTDDKTGLTGYYTESYSSFVITAGDGTITVDNTVYSNKTAISNVDASLFIGNWQETTSEDILVLSSLSSAKLNRDELEAYIVHDYLVLGYYGDYYILQKSGDQLVGYFAGYNAAPKAVTFDVYEGEIGGGDDDEEDIDVSQVVGYWTNSVGEHIIILVTYASDDIVAHMIVNGENWIDFEKDGNKLIGQDKLTYNDVVITYNADSGVLTLVTLDFHEEEIGRATYTQSSPSTSTTIADFEGAWHHFDYYEDEFVVIIDGDSITLNDEATSISYQIVDKYLIIHYIVDEGGYWGPEDYYYVLHVEGDNLEGIWASAFGPEEVTLEPKDAGDDDDCEWSDFIGTYEGDYNEKHITVVITATTVTITVDNDTYEFVGEFEYGSFTGEWNSSYCQIENGDTSADTIGVPSIGIMIIGTTSGMVYLDRVDA